MTSEEVLEGSRGGQLWDLKRDVGEKELLSQGRILSPKGGVESSNRE